MCDHRKLPGLLYNPPSPNPSPASPSRLTSSNEPLGIILSLSPSVLSGYPSKEKTPCSALQSLLLSPRLCPLPLPNKSALPLLRTTPRSPGKNAQRPVAAPTSPVPSPSMLTGAGSTTSVDTPTATRATLSTLRTALTTPAAQPTALSMVQTTAASTVSPPLVTL
ncbi:hypothetical protein FRC16_010515 [Serendipita sp. 398]|nr:hypothetical protein FRC16_010515 [Serendipita sp. 398]